MPTLWTAILYIWFRNTKLHLSLLSWLQTHSYTWPLNGFGILLVSLTEFMISLWGLLPGKEIGVLFSPFISSSFSSFIQKTPPHCSCCGYSKTSFDLITYAGLKSCKGLALWRTSSPSVHFSCDVNINFRKCFTSPFKLIVYDLQISKPPAVLSYLRPPIELSPFLIGCACSVMYLFYRVYTLSFLEKNPSILNSTQTTLPFGKFPL